MIRMLYTIVLGSIWFWLNSLAWVSMHVYGVLDSDSQVLDRVFGAWLIASTIVVVSKYGWNAKRFTSAPEQDIEAEVDSE